MLYIIEDECNCCVARLLLLLFCWCGDIESLNEERYWLRELKKIKISELWTNLEIMLEYEFMMLTLPPDELSNKKLLLNKLATENESKWRTAIWQP